MTKFLLKCPMLWLWGFQGNPRGSKRAQTINSPYFIWNIYYFYFLPLPVYTVKDVPVQSFEIKVRDNNNATEVGHKNRQNITLQFRLAKKLLFDL